VKYFYKLKGKNEALIVRQTAKQMTNKKEKRDKKTTTRCVVIVDYRYLHKNLK
jgi:hypothetical protein